MLALGMVATTGLGLLAGHADVEVAQPTVSIVVDTTLWAAWTGLGLALISAVAALVPFVAETRGQAPGAAAPRAPA